MSREGPDYRTSTEYFRDRAWDEKRAMLDGEEYPCLRINGKRVHVEHVYPPIPIRTMDWRATFEGYEPGDIMGEGPTKLAALQDLKEQDDAQ